MRRMVSRTGLVVSALALAMSASGCLLALIAGGAAGGAAAYAYVRGEGKETYAVPFDQVEPAMAATLKDFDMVVIERNTDPVTLKMTAHDPHQRDVHVTLFAQTQHLTEVTIRVGTFGDQELTRALFNRLDGHLGRNQPTSQPAPRTP